MPPPPSLSTERARLLLRARVILPMVSAPIENGAVLLVNGQIHAVGPWNVLRRLRRDASFDLGQVILLPGLINCHCHLDYTGMAGQISSTPSFSDWIKGMLALKAHATYSDYALSWLRGARMLLNHGVTTVADIEAVPELLPEVRSATPLRVCSLLEMTGVKSRRPPVEILRGTVAKIDSLPAGANWAGLSPHAPYSTSPELLRLSGEVARQRRWLTATHVAESEEEFEMFASAGGPMFEWLQSQRDMSDCGVGSPVQHLQRQGLLGNNLLAVHANYLASGDAELLGRSDVSVVHCPRSHDYFGHRPFSRLQLTAAGVNICLGTDSLASVRPLSRQELELDLLAEMRTMAQHDPGLSPQTLLRMATLNGARALHLEGKAGQLVPGACADLITVPHTGGAGDPYETVLAHTGFVSGVMIGGRWLKQPDSGQRSSLPQAGSQAGC